MYTLRISDEIVFGPLEEKCATEGAGDFPMDVLLGDITTGFLYPKDSIYDSFVSVQIKVYMSFIFHIYACLIN